MTRTYTWITIGSVMAKGKELPFQVEIILGLGHIMMFNGIVLMAKN